MQTIYNQQGNKLFEIEPSDSSFRNIAIMSDDSVTLNFESAEHIDIPVRSYILYKAERFTLWKPEHLKKVNSRNFEYSLLLGSNRELLKCYKYKQLSAIPYELKFPLTAKPRVFIELLVKNLNLHDSGWKVGECLEANEKLISFNHEYCFDALDRIAKEFSTEWNIEGKTISLCKVEKYKDDPVSLSYGRGNGFRPGVSRSNEGDKQPVGVLCVQGGERNIDFSKYKSKTLLLPKSATLEYEGKTYISDEHGMLITQLDNPNTSEDSYDASNIYPKRVGTVSKVEKFKKKDKEGKEYEVYDIVDSSIPDNLDFSQHRIGGEKATIIFQSGALAGREFDIQTKDDKLVGYVHSERRFKLVQSEQDGIIMPGGTFVPKPGDEYAVFHISLPDAYICDDAAKSGASWDMFREAVRYFHENANPRFTLTGELDPIFAKEKWSEIGAKLVTGGYIYCDDQELLPNSEKIRITGVKEYLNKPYSPILTLSNVTVSGGIGSDFGKLEAEEVTTDKRVKEVQNYTSRTYSDVMQNFDMIFDTEGAFFQEKIRPLAIHTAQLIVAENSGQFELIDVLFKPNLNDDANSFSSTAGKLVHLTINGDGTARSWNVATLAPLVLEKDTPYYVYAKCQKEGESASILVTEEQITVSGKEGHYHLLIGTLGSVNDGVRAFNPKYGVSEMAGQFLTTGVIKDRLASLVIDLVNRKITAKDGAIIEGAIKFLSGSSGYNNLSDKPDLSVFEKAENLEYLKQALKGATDIVGGLVLASFIAARDESGNVRSYLSGIGETAFAAGVKNFLKENETKNVDLRHDGTGNIGVFTLREDGSIALVVSEGDSAGKDGVIFSNEKLPAISELHKEADIEYYSTPKVIPVINLPNENGFYGKFICNITIGKDDSVLYYSFKAVEIKVAPMQGKNFTSIIGQKFTLKFTLGYNGDFIQEIFQREIIITENLKNFDEIWCEGNHALLANMKKGYYAIFLEVIPETSDFSVHITPQHGAMAPYFRATKYARYSRMQIGYEGICAAFRNSHFYYSYQTGVDIKGKLKHVGELDISGVLAAGTIDGQGVHSNYCGAKVDKNGADNSSVGKYTVFHDVGHRNYSVQLTPHGHYANGRYWGVDIIVRNKQALSFDVEVIADNTQHINSGFEYMIIGHNYNP